MRILITGGAGFIASNLTDRLLREEHSVISVDNLLLGRMEHIKPFIDNHNFKFKEIDLLDRDGILPLFDGIELVFHMSANSDILRGANCTDRDLTLGTMATYNVLEAMRLNSVKDIIFASTSAVYGVAKQMPTKEDYGPLFPISLYGASKVACETLISAFCHNFYMKAWIFRFANVIGRNPTHGIVFDLIRKLKDDSCNLEVLGDGKQSKPYLHVDDIVDGMLFGFLHSNQEINFFNLACDGATSVSFIVNAFLKRLGMHNTTIHYTGTKQGWKGDVPQVRLSTEKMKALGWGARFNSEDAVLKGIDEIVLQLW